MTLRNARCKDKDIYELSQTAQKTVSANTTIFFFQFAGNLSASKNIVFQHLVLNLPLLFTNISNISPNSIKQNSIHNFMLPPRESLQKFEAIPNYLYQKMALTRNKGFAMLTEPVSTPAGAPFLLRR